MESSLEEVKKIHHAISGQKSLQGIGSLNSRITTFMYWGGHLLAGSQMGKYGRWKLGGRIGSENYGIFVPLISLLSCLALSSHIRRYYMKWCYTLAARRKTDFFGPCPVSDWKLFLRKASDFMSSSRRGKVTLFPFNSASIPTYQSRLRRQSFF